MVHFLALDTSATETIDFLALDTSMEYIKAGAATFLFFLGFVLFSKVAEYVFTFVFGLLIVGIICWLGSEIGHEHITEWKQVAFISVGTGILSSIVLTPFLPMLDMNKNQNS